MKLRPIALLCSLLLTPPLFAADSAANYYESALRYSQQGELKKAEIELRNSLQQQADYLPARLLLGKVLLQSAQWPSAEKELQLALAGGAAADPLVFDLMRALLAQEKADEVDLLLRQYQALAAQPAAMLIKARLAKLKADLPQAEQLLKQALQQSLSAELAAECWYELGDLQFQQQQFSDATSSLMKVAANSSFYRQAQYLQAQILQAKEPQKALAIYQQLLTKDPTDAAALLAKAQLLLQQGQLAEALALVLKFRQQYPENPYGQLIHAALVGEQGDVAERDRMVRQVRQQLSSLSSEQKDQEDVLILNAVLDFSESKFDAVVRRLQTYLQRYPANARVEQLLAQSYFFLQRFAEAEQHINTALKLTPQDENLYLIAASILQAADKAPAALTLLTDAYQRFPRNTLLSQAYTQALVSAGQTTAAQEVLAKSLDKPDPLAELLLLGYLQLEAGQLAEASANASKLLALSQSKVEVFQFAGDVSLRGGDIEKAKAFFQQALVLDAASKPALLSLAGLAINQQLWAEAINYYQQILQTAPTDSLTLQLLADAALKSGAPDVSIDALEKLDGDLRDLLPAKMALLELYFFNGDIAKAEPLLTQLTEVSDLKADIYVAKVKLALLQKNRATAQHNTDILYGLWFDNPTSLLQLTDLQFRNLDHEGAAKTLARLQELDADPAMVLTLQIRLSLHHKQYQLAKVQLQKLEKLQGVTSQSQELQAHLLLGNQEYPAAVALLQTLWQAQADPRYFAMLMTATRAMNDPKALIKLLQQQLAANPNDLAARLELTELLRAAGDIGTAKQLFLQAEDLAEQPILLNNLADLLMATEPELSLQYAQQAYQLLPQHPQIIDTYGWALSQNRQPERGLGILRDAEIRDPANMTIQLHLAGTLMLLKREAEAQQIFSALAGKALNKTEQQLLQQLQKN